MVQTSYTTHLEQAYKLMSPCRLCPRNCGVMRLEGQKGFCGIGHDAVVSSFGPHFGEESPLVGRYGSGTIFFAGCNLGCIFCQNYDISHLWSGEEVSTDYIASLMLALEKRGCHNINFVTPTHVSPQIMEATQVARGKGLNVPTVYNCGGYESVETLKLLEGTIDIYMPDAKYADPEWAKKFSGAEDYPEVMKAAIKEMHRQVGDLVIENGIAVRGLLVRHLVMPNNVAGSKEIIAFIAEEISLDTYINVMDQYYPCYRAGEFGEINRRITYEEFNEVYSYAQSKGLRLAE
ncbi:MAG: radical SAM protein [Planctomycetes bacterium GWA2_50_13]|nr:MAG: radical SAM protein [Planctomycetes bacterium GWA2_50_13]OHB95770.1 MAG: radical SAM protein [Planctomycetes bacterium RIFCSPLOWO2_02_FULL_50_16]OHC03071.1 MAG: radical SAM protein [Planctomycetes bacterium RIFCSPLOWO2_12_FULL_50_35]HCN19521.1 radical SAM protein [Planctomycetia bacterium]